MPGDRSAPTARARLTRRIASRCSGMIVANLLAQGHRRTYLGRAPRRPTFQYTPQRSSEFGAVPGGALPPTVTRNRAQTAGRLSLMICAPTMARVAGLGLGQCVVTVQRQHVGGVVRIRRGGCCRGPSKRNAALAGSIAIRQTRAEVAAADADPHGRNGSVGRPPGRPGVAVVAVPAAAALRSH